MLSSKVNLFANVKKEEITITLEKYFRIASWGLGFENWTKK